MTSSVQVIQQSVQVLSQPVAYNSQAIAQQSGQVLSQPVASHSQAIAQRQPGQLVVSSMSHLLDPPKLTVRFPSFVTQEKLIQNSIDRSSELTNQPYKSQYTLNLILVVQTSVTRCWNKSSLNISKSGPKSIVGTPNFRWKEMFFKTTQKVTKYLVNICWDICHQEL